MNEELEKYAKALSASVEVLRWLATTGQKYIKTLDEGEHIIDFLISPNAPKRLQRLSFLDAKRLTKRWSDSNQKKGRNLIDSTSDIETIHDFLDGTRIVKLKTKTSFQREGFLMGHCVGGYGVNNKNSEVYSYRDKNNLPHATFEIQKKNKEIVQIKGKGNGAIHPKYIHPILTFLNIIGMQIRPNDMKNLGYYHIHKDHIEFLKKIPNASEQIVIIGGEAYAF